MAFTYGFYNSKGGDRKYNADQMGNLFDGILNDGVFDNVGNIFATVPGEGLQVLVKSGRAWFNKTWSYNDAAYPIYLERPDVAVPRIDAIVLEVDRRETHRRNRIGYIVGIPDSTPKKPTLTNTDLIHQHPLAYVTVRAGTESILHSDIEIRVGQSDCPFVTGILQTANIDDLFAAWNEQFTTWFEGVRSQLEGDVAANLLREIQLRLPIADKATSSEVGAGTVDNKYITPKGLANYLGKIKDDTGNYVSLTKKTLLYYASRSDYRTVIQHDTYTNTFYTDMRYKYAGNNSSSMTVYYRTNDSNVERSLSFNIDTSIRSSYTEERDIISGSSFAYSLYNDDLIAIYYTGSSSTYYAFDMTNLSVYELYRYGSIVVTHKYIYSFYNNINPGYRQRTVNGPSGNVNNDGALTGGSTNGIYPGGTNDSTGGLIVFTYSNNVIYSSIIVGGSYSEKNVTYVFNQNIRIFRAIALYDLQNYSIVELRTTDNKMYAKLLVYYGTTCLNLSDVISSGTASVGFSCVPLGYYRESNHIYIYVLYCDSIDVYDIYNNNCSRIKHIRLVDFTNLPRILTSIRNPISVPRLAKKDIVLLTANNTSYMLDIRNNIAYPIIGSIGDFRDMHLNYYYQSMSLPLICGIDDLNNYTLAFIVEVTGVQ